MGLFLVLKIEMLLVVICGHLYHQLLPMFSSSWSLFISVAILLLAFEHILKCVVYQTELSSNLYFGIESKHYNVYLSHTHLITIKNYYYQIILVWFLLNPWLALTLMFIVHYSCIENYLSIWVLPTFIKFKGSRSTTLGEYNLVVWVVVKTRVFVRGMLSLIRVGTLKCLCHLESSVVPNAR